MVRVTIPANTSALIVLTSDDPSKILESGTSVTVNKKFKSVSKKNNKTELEAGSGEYVFEISE